MALGESRRRKLEMLLRARTKDALDNAAELLGARGGAKRPAPATPPAAPFTPTAPIALSDACPGVETIVDGYKHWLIRRTLADVEPESLAVAREFAAVLRGARQNFDELAASPAVCHAANASPEDLLFMDTETCGLAGTMIFLIGVMFYEGDQLVFEQHLARDYAEEPAILRAFDRRYEACSLLVTFNGKSFDMTQIRDRRTYHALEAPWSDPPHLDLLHESRRRWKGELRSFKLQNLERHFCGRHRVGDIPGAAIPDAYHEFVRTADARRMRDILHHNLLDLLTMAQLVTILLTACDPTGEDA